MGHLQHHPLYNGQRQALKFGGSVMELFKSAAFDRTTGCCEIPPGWDGFSGCADGWSVGEASTCAN